jgi:hypothetical protein
MNANAVTLAVAVAAAILKPCAAGAQDVSLATTLLLQVGTRPILIIDDAGKELRGEIVHVASDAVTLRAGAMQYHIDLDRVRRIERRGDSPWDGAVVGAGIGAAVAAASWLLRGTCAVRIVYECDYNPGDYLTLGESGSAIVGFAAVGLLVDLFHTKRTVLWLASQNAPIQPNTRTFGAQLRQAAPAVMIGYRRSF